MRSPEVWEQPQAHTPLKCPPPPLGEHTRTRTSLTTFRHMKTSRGYTAI
jgi:hypothetical protein